MNFCSFNVDSAAEHVKNIIESIRCAVCDVLVGDRIRLPCRHIVCSNCANKEECLICLTPPEESSSPPVLDEPSTSRAKNASALLNAFQDTFDINVYNRHRISEKLRIEKELFPKCIQAPTKYCNKKRVIASKNKENYLQPSVFLGENISPIKDFKMEKSKAYVEQWLNKNQTSLTSQHRKVFGDLAVNQQNSAGYTTSTPKVNKSSSLLKNYKENVSQRSLSRKRSHFKSSLSMIESQSKLDTYLKPTGIIDKSFGYLKKIENEQSDQRCNKRKKYDELKYRDESGIVLDDETIVIEDSQSQVVDKDKLALLAVLEADKQNQSFIDKLENSEARSPISKVNESMIQEQNTKHSTVKVPFYKRSYLLETCDNCNNHYDDNNKTAGKSNDVAITIENDSFVTTIRVSNIRDSKLSNLHSTIVQTDISSVDKNNDIHIPTSDIIIKDDKNTESEDLFTNEVKEENVTSKLIFNKDVQKAENIELSKGVVISDSDSDFDVGEGSMLEVTAEVHRSNDQISCGVLKELEESDYRNRLKHKSRAFSPTSTNSSDKENLDPNRAKRRKHEKKKTKKASSLQHWKV